MSEKNRWKFFDVDGQREAFAVNAPLIIANRPRKKRKTAGAARRKKGATMAKAKRGAHGRFVKNRKTTTTHHKKRSTSSHRRRKANYMNPGMLVNRKKKHHRKHNPPKGLSLAGIPLPSITTMAYALAGVVGPGLFSLAVQDYQPTWTATPNGKSAVKVGSYAVPPLLAWLFAGKRAAGWVLFGEGMAIAAQEIMSYATTGAFSNPLAGYLPTMPGPGVSTAKQLGSYVPGPTMGMRRGMRGYPTAPDRLARRYGSW